MGTACQCQVQCLEFFVRSLRVLRIILSSHRVNVTLAGDRTRFDDASELRIPNSELFPPLPAVFAVARRVRRVNSYVVPAQPAVPAV